MKNLLTKAGRLVVINKDPVFIPIRDKMTEQQMNGQKRKAAIIEAAIKVIARTSFENCSTIAIAEAAGITEPLIYYHFKTKKDLQLAVLDSVVAGVIPVLILIPVPVYRILPLTFRNSAEFSVVIFGAGPSHLHPWFFHKKYPSVEN